MPNRLQCSIVTVAIVSARVAGPTPELSICRQRRSRPQKVRPVTTQRRAKPWVLTSAGFAPTAVHGSSAASPTQDTASPLRVLMTRVCSNRSSKFGPPKRSLGTTWIRNCKSSSGIQLENSIDGWTCRMKMLDSNPVSDLPLVRAKF